MTAGAGFRQLLLAGRLAMAACAARLAVRPLEREAALLRVIEIPLLPGSGVMAIRAFRSEFPTVGVVDRVAGDAVLRRSFVALGDVAARTARLAMCARERVFGFRMVELRRLPARFTMALTAIRRQRAFVDVVVSMTCDAVGGSVPTWFVRQVALIAGGGLMSTSKRIVRLRVVEGGIAQTTYVSIPPLVIGVAAHALAFRREWMSCMEARARLQVGGDALVANQAE